MADPFDEGGIDPVNPTPGDENDSETPVETPAETSANQSAYVVVPQTIVTRLKEKYPDIPETAQTIAEAIAGIPVAETAEAGSET